MKALLITAAALSGLAYLVFGRAPEAPAPPAATDPATLAEGAMVDVALPDALSPEAVIGQRSFEATCAACHGVNGAGRDGVGPPLIHKIYEPSHHGDQSFQIAVAQGVRAHHWRFGNMPPQEGLTRADVTGIIAYVRAVQRANGID